MQQISRLACGIATAQGDQSYEGPRSRGGFKCPFTHTSNQMPAIVLQQLFAELTVAGQEQPVLRQHNTGCATLYTELKATIKKYRGKIVLAFGVIAFAVVLEGIVLLAARQVRH